MTDTWVREAVPADEVLGPLCEAFGHYQWVHLWGPLNVADPNIHVNMLGVPPRYQGAGSAACCSSECTRCPGSTPGRAA